MKFHILFVLLVLSIGAYAQTPTSENKTIRWGAWSGTDGCCLNYLKDGVLITEYYDDRLGYSISLHPDKDKKYLFVLIVMQSYSDTPFTVYPENFHLRMTEPVNKTYAALSPDDVMKEINKRGQWRMGIAAALSGVATRQTTGTVTDSQGNTADVRISEPDYEGQNRTANQAADKQANNAARAAVVQNSALRANTVRKDQIIGGVVFFKKDKLAPGFILSFTIDNTTYEIPYGTERVKAAQIPAPPPPKKL